MPTINVQRIQAYLLREKAICLLPLIAIWCGLTLSTHWHPTWDSAIYISMGKSIITGGGSRYMDYGGIKYPPGFPFMLGLIIGPFGYNFLLMRMLIVASAVGAIWLAYLIVRDESNRWLAAGVMCSTAFSFPVIFECTRILSDLPYTFLSLLALRWVKRYARETEPWRGKTAYLTLGLMLAAYFTRIVGVTLFAGACAYLALGGRGLPRSRTNLKKAIAVAVVLITIPPLWTVQNQIRGPRLPPELREALSYERELIVRTTADPNAPIVRWKALAERIKDNSRYYEVLLSNIVSGKRLDSEVRARIITCVLLVGYLYCVFWHRSVLEYYTFFYMLTYILWTSKQGERFLVPIIPILFYYLFRLLALMMSGCQWLIRRIFQWKDRRRAIEAAAVAILTAILIQWNWASDMAIIERERRQPYYTGGTAILMDFAGWLKDHTPPETVVISDSPSFIYLFSERKTFSFTWIKDVDEVLASMVRLGADYVLSTPGSRSTAFLHPVLEAYPDRFDEVYRRGEYVIYRVNGNGEIPD